MEVRIESQKTTLRTDSVNESGWHCFIWCRSTRSCMTSMSWSHRSGASVEPDLRHAWRTHVKHRTLGSAALFPDWNEWNTNLRNLIRFFGFAEFCIRAYMHQLKQAPSGCISRTGEPLLNSWAVQESTVHKQIWPPIASSAFSHMIESSEHNLHGCNPETHSRCRRRLLPNPTWAWLW